MHEEKFYLSYGWPLQGKYYFKESTKETPDGEEIYIFIRGGKTCTCGPRRYCCKEAKLEYRTSTATNPWILSVDEVFVCLFHGTGKSEFRIYFQKTLHANLFLFKKSNKWPKKREICIKFMKHFVFNPSLVRTICSWTNYWYWAAKGKNTTIVLLLLWRKSPLSNPYFKENQKLSVFYNGQFGGHFFLDKNVFNKCKMLCGKNFENFFDTQKKFFFRKNDKKTIDSCKVDFYCSFYFCSLLGNQR